MREFNIFGPVYPEIHYHVDRVAIKAELRARIDKGRYLTLNAARQTGKTTLFQEMIGELEATGEYFGILLDFESLDSFSQEDFYEELGWLLQEWRESKQPTVFRALSPLNRSLVPVRWIFSPSIAINALLWRPKSGMTILAIKRAKPSWCAIYKPLICLKAIWSSLMKN